MARPKLTMTPQGAGRGVLYWKQCARCRDLIGPFHSDAHAYRYPEECVVCQWPPKPSKTWPTKQPP